MIIPVGKCSYCLKSGARDKVKKLPHRDQKTGRRMCNTCHVRMRTHRQKKPRSREYTFRGSGSSLADLKTRTALAIGMTKKGMGDNCSHVWMIEEPNGPTSDGKCRSCGAEGVFNNSPPEVSSWTRLGKT